MLHASNITQSHLQEKEQQELRVVRKRNKFLRENSAHAWSDLVLAV